MNRDWISDCIYMCNGIRDYEYNGIRIIVSNSETTFPKGHHNHEEYEFMYLKNKSIMTLCNGNDIPIQKGHIMPFNSFDLHGQRNSVSINGFMCIILDANLVRDTASNGFGFSKKPIFKNKCFIPSPSLSYYLGVFIDKCGSENSADKLCLSLLLQLIIIELFKCSENNVKTHEVNTNNSIIRGKKFLDENYTSEFNLQQIADAAGMNKFYFIKKFTEEMGLSPKQYFLKFKIEKAKYLIALREMNLTDIAYELGYSSQSHFSTHFKKETGITPREYQKKVSI